MILITIMYTGRVARFNLLKPVGFLAKHITRWNTACDKRLHRIMCYIKTTLTDDMCGWIGDDVSKLTAHMFMDADFAGDPFTRRSTSGRRFDIQGPNSRFPISCASKVQASTAQSSTEAEIVSMCMGMKETAEPALTMLNVILGHFHRKLQKAAGNQCVPGEEWSALIYLH